MHARLSLELDDRVLHGYASHDVLEDLVLRVLLLVELLFFSVHFACELQVDSLGLLGEEGQLEESLEVLLGDVGEQFELLVLPIKEVLVGADLTPVTIILFI